MRRLYTTLYFVSGFTVLAIETIWIRLLALDIGNTALSGAMVICVFFIGGAIGNLAAAGLAGSVSRPARLYGLAEIAFALSALLLISYQRPLWMLINPGITTGLASQLLKVISLIALPSICAGASFPLLTAALLQHADSRTRVAGGLYLSNLLGAAAGIIIGGILLPMHFGYAQTTLWVTASGFTAGLTAILASQRLPLRRPGRSAPCKVSTQPGDYGMELKASTGYAIMFFSGALSLGLEALVLMYFMQCGLGSIYLAGATILAFLIGLSAGCGGAVLLRKSNRPPQTLLALGCWVTGAVLALYPHLFQKLLTMAWMTTSSSSLPALASILMGKAIVILLPMLIMVGAVFPLTWDSIKQLEVRHGRVLGFASAFNKCGGALGALLIPFVLVPICGLPITLLLIASGYLLLGLRVELSCPLERLSLRPKAILLRAAPVSLLLLSWLFIRDPICLAPETSLLGLYQGHGNVTAVVQTAGSRHIILNQLYQLNGTQEALLSQQQEGWIPLLFRENTQRVLFIGMASGISAAATLDFPIAELQAVELVPEVIAAAQQHFAQWNQPLFSDPRARVIANDGRYIMQSAKQPFDLIICDLMHPKLEGTANLYSRDFFAAAERALSTHGLFCLWLPLYQLDHDLTDMVLGTFRDVFHHAIAIRGNFDPFCPIIGLLGSREPLDWSDDFLQSRWQTASIQQLAARSVFFRSVANLRLLMLGDMQAVKNEWRNLPLNSDDRPLFAFLAPKEIAPGQNLRGTSYLDYFGRQLLSPYYPSCQLNDGDLLATQKGQLAGNYLFAAAIALAPIPTSPSERNRRDKQALLYLQAALALAPDAQITLEDLSQ